jgi:hypothetical protein
MGADAAAFILCVAGAGFALTCAFFVLRKLAGPKPALIGTLLLATWPDAYGAFGVHRLVEPFATPRPWAEGLILLGALAAVSDRKWFAAAAVAAAMLIHPLLALPGAAWIALIALRWRTSALLVASAAAGVGAACALGIAPFDQLFRTIDPAWRELLEARVPDLFVARWPSWDVRMAALSILATIVARCDLAARTDGSSLLPPPLGAGACGTLVGVDWLSSTLVAQVQPWRALWVSTFAALGGLGVLITRAVMTELRERIAAAGIDAGLVLGSSVGWSRRCDRAAGRISTDIERAVRRWWLIAAALIWAMRFSGTSESTQ